MSVKEYICKKPEFKLMPFMTVYLTIMELINDGYLPAEAFVDGGNENAEKLESESQR